MQSGKLRNKITIEEPSASYDDYGDETLSWSTLAAVWADRMPSRATESFDESAGEVVATVTETFVVRYRSDVTTQMRVADGSRTLNIISALPDDRNTKLYIRCREVNI